MLHGGRLGNVREDVAHFTSSRKDDNRLAAAVLAINKAHVAMIIEQKIIQQQSGAKILAALNKLSVFTLDPNAEDVHMAIEEAVLQGGFGSAVLEFSHDHGFHHGEIERMGIPDQFIEHGNVHELLEEIGLTTEGIVKKINSMNIKKQKGLEI